MKDGLAALTKFVKVVMAYRPDRTKNGKASSKGDAKTPAPKRANKGRPSA
jgi:hypothetical protein